jgi:hypothetical protein
MRAWIESLEIAGRAGFRLRQRQAHCSALAFLSESIAT